MDDITHGGVVYLPTHGVFNIAYHHSAKCLDTEPGAHVVWHFDTCSGTMTLAFDSALLA